MASATERVKNLEINNSFDFQYKYNIIIILFIFIAYSMISLKEIFFKNTLTLLLTLLF